MAQASIKSTKKPREKNLVRGNIPDHFKALAIPAGIGMLFNTLYNVVDTFFAGMISTDAQAGLSVSFTVVFILIAFGIGLGQGISALVGTSIGVGTATGVNKSTGTDSKIEADTTAGTEKQTNADDFQTKDLLAPQ